MKLIPLLALSLTGCSLYFGSDEPQQLGGPNASADRDEAPKCGSPELHIISAYESHGNHSGNHHPPGDAQVKIERPGDHALVLSAYEPVNWNVTTAPGVNIKSVTLIGYHQQNVNLKDVPVVRRQGCGYAYPDNEGGCNTEALLALAEEVTGAKLTTFHGCYQASSWTLRADGTASSNCNTSAGYEVSELRSECVRGEEPRDEDWKKSDFKTYSPAACTGDRFVRFDASYDLYVGAILCGDPKRYKLYLSDSLEGQFLEISDYAGHGQDHCELVNPDFTIPVEDDITSGGCTECSVDQLIDINGIPTYARARFGDPFHRVTARFWADLTTAAYSCGVAIP
jgi:hypothetical protein